MNSVNKYRVGQRVHHRLEGPGTVVELPVGNDSFVLVKLDSGKTGIVDSRGWFCAREELRAAILDAQPAPAPTGFDRIYLKKQSAWSNEYKYTCSVCCRDDFRSIIAAKIHECVNTAYPSAPESRATEAKPGEDADHACIWSCDDDVRAPGTWDGTCGVRWTFTDGGPTENEVNYCPRCGGKAVVSTTPQAAE